MFARSVCMAAVLLSTNAASGSGLLSHLFHKAPGCGCEVHVHYLKGAKSCSSEPAQEPARERRAARASSPYQGAAIVPATYSYAMPAMPMIAASPIYAPQRTPSQNQSNCAACEARIERLEEGVKTLNDRMDRIEEVLRSQNAALTGIRDLMQKHDWIEKQ